MSRTFKADLSLVVCTVIWGASFVIVKSALADASVFAFLLIRFAVAALSLAILCFRDLARLNSASLRAGAVLGCCMFGGYAFQTAGIQLTTPSKAAFVTGFSVVLVPIFLGVFARHRVGPWIWAGTLTAIGGLYYLTVPSSGFGGLNFGDVLVLCWFGGLRLAHHRHRPLCAHPLSHLAEFSAGRHDAGHDLRDRCGPKNRGKGIAARCLDNPASCGCSSTGILATALTFAVQLWAQRFTSPTHAAILFTLEPVFAALTSFAFFHERFAARGLAGAALILVGILLAEFKGPAPSATEQS